MDSELSGIKIEKLNDSNFHIWKVKIQIVLSIRELEKNLEAKSTPAQTAPNYRDWWRSDAKARAFIGLSLSNNHLEQVQHSKSAKEMWKSVCDIYEKHTLLNQLTARRRFYTAAMKESDKILDFAARIRHHSSVLKSMGTTVNDQDMAMTFLSGLPDRFDVLISALDAISDDKDKFTFDFVVSRCQLEEQRHTDRDQQSMEKSEAAALISKRSRGRGNCIHYGKHDDSSKCWKKFPYLAPEGHPYKLPHKALLSKQKEEEVDEVDLVCLLGKEKEFALINDSHKSLSVQTRNMWILDSGCSAHLCHNRSLFTTYSTTKPRPVDLGANYSAMIIGQGDITLNVIVRGQMKQCIIKICNMSPNSSINCYQYPLWRNSEYEPNSMRLGQNWSVI